jgi:hypothetical protein
MNDQRNDQRPTSGNFTTEEFGVEKPVGIVDSYEAKNIRGQAHKIVVLASGRFRQSG